MLPALHIGGAPATEPTYTRRPSWCLAHESLWGILAKWQFINCLPYSTLARCVSSLTHAESYQGVDLRVLDGFDLAAMTINLGVPQAALVAGACSAVADSTVLVLASVNLRFCPSCMRAGFHATLFQFTPILHCPIHNERLRDTCRSCGRQIAYRMDTAFAARPLSCPHCQRSLLAHPTILAHCKLLSADAHKLMQWERLLAKYAYWYTLGPRARTAPSSPPATAAPSSSAVQDENPWSQTAWPSSVACRP